ncbi:3-phosphoshikimate 1-carboxyvinyltransferase [Lachnoclostridium sp. An131]|uniref:3-phosphoshikimate 1-carboxyvinyltransferase n=1 Tax=Lachnoclostridium sp. An131 TaxID=1965555 RepID=UPI000B3899E0|nr:3-phosphoshikimate 1-carboxyvinyltransferase [Lachnoclostridium sp. An131]OUQ25920.1 3-phosphoshikimate 1-carboxyvinyltransferase [Lachnoclostridium sp. An131]
MKFTRVKSLRGEITVPGDKSISHRAVMFGSLAQGTTTVENFLRGADCLSTIDCFRRLGIQIDETPELITIHGKGLHGLTAPSQLLDAGNSGTTTRLISGILSGQSFETTLTGDASIQKRPMKRIIEPLTQMGASITSLHGNGCAPLNIQGRPLHGIHYTTKVASAQVKSSILLAGLYADSATSVTEPALSRNHSELMLRQFGADVQTEGTTATIQPGPALAGQKIVVPGDISSAAYFIAAACITPDSELLIRNVGTNPTRDGILRVCRMMNADVTILPHAQNDGEPSADLLIRSSSLKGCVIEGELIPTLIDELPVIAVMACFAEGTTIIRDAAELKVKESNRIDVMAENLTAMGAQVTATDDGLIIEGGRPLRGAAIDSHLDHRIAMSFAVAALNADGETEIQDAECVNISYPAFYQDLNRISSRT